MKEGIKYDKTPKYKPKTRLYRIWINMKTRCYNKNAPNYKKYGFKGITIHKEWINNFKAFQEWSLSNGYADDLTIDRIDCTKGYEPSNCRWTTYKQQARNKTKNKLITYNGETHCISEWGEILGVDYRNIWQRLKNRLSIADALSTENFQKRKVECIELKTVFPSITEAKKQLNIKGCHICDCCTGKRNKADGYTWRYVNE